MYQRNWIDKLIKPFTYWLRDFWAKFEFFWIVGLVSLGVWLGHNYDWEIILKGWLIFSAGYLGGHLFWSTTSEKWGDK